MDRPYVIGPFWPRLGIQLQNDLFELEISISGIIKGIRFKFGLFPCSFWVWRKCWVNLGKNYRLIHLTLKFPFWVFERWSFLIWLLILIVLYIYFNWGKYFAGRIRVWSKNGLLDSKSLKLSVKLFSFSRIIFGMCLLFNYTATFIG